MVAFLDRMPAGIPGDITRKQNARVEAGVFDGTNPPATYGIPAVVDATSKAYRQVIAGDKAATITGFFIRPYPTSMGVVGGALGTSPVNTGVAADILKGGYINALLNAGTAAKDGQVYVRTANASGAKVVGGVEAALEWGSSSAAKSGGNTGNGTFVLDATTPVAANATVGVYQLRVVEAVTNGGKFVLFDPNGFQLGMWIVVAGAGGTITVNDQIKGVITDGSTDFAVGDGFDITVVGNTIAVPNSKFTGPADASGNVEVQYNV